MRPIPPNHIAASQLCNLANPCPAVGTKPRCPPSRSGVSRAYVADGESGLEYHPLFFGVECLGFAQPSLSRHSNLYVGERISVDVPLPCRPLENRMARVKPCVVDRARLA